MDLGKFILATVGVLVVAEILDSLSENDHDTVNYALKSKRGHIVYHGITYEDRLDARLDEHERSGKRFYICDYDYPKPRLKAEAIERKRIKRDRPKYNLHHNC